MSGMHRQCYNGRATLGEVSEWLMVPLSKSGVAQVTAGSNPALSASFYEQNSPFPRFYRPAGNHPTGRFVAHLSPKFFFRVAEHLSRGHAVGVRCSTEQSRET